MLKSYLKVAAVMLFVLAVTVPAFHFTAAAQNISFMGRFPSDSGKAVFGYGTATDTSAQTMASAQGAGVFVYVYQAACYNTSGTAAVAILKSSTTAVAAIPCVPSAGFTQPIIFYPPLKMPAANQAFTMEASTSVTTAYFYSVVRTAR